MKAAQASAAAGIMLTESDSLVRPLPGLLDELGEADQRRLQAIGRDKPLSSGEFVWQQGDGQTGIYLIRSGRIRSYYVAPSGREVTLAYGFRATSSAVPICSAPDRICGRRWRSNAAS